MITNEDFNYSMKEAAQKTPDLSDKKYAELTKKYMQRKREYADAGNDSEGTAKKEMINREVQGDKEIMTRALELQSEIASVTTNSNKFGHNPIGKLGEDGAKLLSDIATGKNELTFDEENKPGYKTDAGHFMPIDAVKVELLEPNKVDHMARKGVKAIMDDSVRKAKNILPNENHNFDYQKEFNNIKNKIVDNGNLKSLANDKIFGNRVFKDDLKSAIELGNYQEMGLTEEQLHLFDPTKGDNAITSEDAEAITQNILQNEDLLKDYLAEYYTKAVEQNFNNNLSTEIKEAKRIKSIEDSAIEYTGN
tara:strand:+ start:416 stop:1336 length:921 start_codon:yes stop_codon:yes gene_type:complete